jgi:TonB family protein
MKKNTVHLIHFAIFLLAQPLLAQNQSLQSAAFSDVPIESLITRNADFPNLGEYLNTRLQYPELAQKNAVEGVVTVEALISDEGQVLSVGLVNGLGFGCDLEVMTLVSNMPDWTPAIENGALVAQKVFIRVRFRLK